MTRDIVDILSDLNNIFTSHDGKKDTNILERYYWFKTHRENGKDCRYAKLCHHRFIDADFDKVKPLIIEAFEALKEIETNNE